MSSVLRASLYQLYANDHAVLNLLDQINWESLTHKFNSELYARMDKESVAVCQSVLNSDLIRRYDLAIAEAAQACTLSISELLSLVILPTEGERGN